MTRAQAAAAALCVCALAAPAAGTPPVVAIRARTAVTLDPVQRQEGGVRVSGLVHERGSLEPVPYAPVTIGFDDQVQSAVAEMDGRFTLFFPTSGGRHRLQVSFRGDERFDPAETAIPDFDVSKRPIRVEVRGPETHSRQEGPLPLSIFAQNETDPVAVQVDVHYGPADADQLEKVSTVFTDARGSAEVSIAAARLGPPGAKRVEVRFAGDDAFDRAAGQTTLLLRSATALTFEPDSRTIGFEGRLRGRGVLKDDLGQGIAGQLVSLSVDGAPAATPEGGGDTPAATEKRTVDDAMTAADGSFVLEARASELGPGSFRVQAVFDSTAPHLDDRRSTPVQVVVAERRPVPVAWSLAAFAFTAGALVAFVALRRRPWTRWVDKLRGETAASAAQPGAQGAPPHTGLALARPGLAATLRRPHDFGFSGLVADAIDGKPIAGARVEVAEPGAEARVASTDEEGRFSLEDLPAGLLRAEVSCKGYVRESFALTIPHRGELRDARVDLLPVRERIFALYRGAAEPLLPRPELWGVWTPRQIVDHVRAARPAGALGALTDYVEEKYFSGRTPDEDEIPIAVERVRAAQVEAAPDLPG
ncbi:MAG TPA: carboxypeptidase regulatory-like domain-containing protein [Kofleriaceae bacterium]|nr:carboxypeptidase regulatory-like domain-containing protein [Kofleriaceae bacterium]